MFTIPAVIPMTLAAGTACPALGFGALGALAATAAALILAAGWAARRSR